MRAVRETLAVLGLAVVVGSVCLSWEQLPARIPAHFGFSGPPNAFGPKLMLAGLPVVTILLYAGLTTLSRFPEHFNYPFRVTEENINRVAPAGVALVGWLKAELMWIFAWLTLTTILVAADRISGLSEAFFPASLATVVATTGYYWRRMLKLA